jgi:ferredoxin
VKTVRVDPIACDGSGLCAELLPERIELDDWGYPIVDPDPLGPELEPHARRAVAECPLLALRLVSVRADESDGRDGGRAARDRAPIRLRD